MRHLLFFLLSAALFASEAAHAECVRTDCAATIWPRAHALLRDAYAQQRTQKSPEQSFAPQTYTLPSYSPQTYATPSFTLQNTAEQPSRPRPPRRRIVKCIIDNAPDDYCSFYSYQVFRSGSPCSCDGSRGAVY